VYEDKSWIAYRTVRGRT